ncbi:pseudouridine synthase [Xylariomycetidae sp. FL2044]|nr:pseudouridine synthase [Xylariomycetidae sp. FL2044]
MKSLRSHCCRTGRTAKSLSRLFITAQCGLSTGLAPLKASPLRMDDKATYAKWTKDALVARIQALEGELRLAQAALPIRAEGGAETGSTTASPLADQPKKAKKKPERKIDPSKYATRLVAFKLAYLGKNYGGFEFAENATLPSIEEELWKAFTKARLIYPENPDQVDWDAWEYSKCGRTDRGVSAFGQVIAVRVRSNRPLPKKPPPPADDEAQAASGGNSAASVSEGADGSNPLDASEKPAQEKEEKEEEEQREFDDFTDELQYCRILNRLLPPDIRVLAWCPTTPAGFSARHDCQERQYRYFFTQPAYAPTPSSLERDRQQGPDRSARRVKDGWLDIEAMRDAARRYEGLHDFRNFCKVDPAKVNLSFERRIFESDIVEVEDAGTALPFLGRPEFQNHTDRKNYDHNDNDNHQNNNKDETKKTLTQSGSPHQFPKVYYFHVRGSAFLWHQIRCMVAVLFSVGQGLEPASVVDALLDVAAEPRRPNYVLANETPLVLWDCVFPRAAETSSSSSPSSEAQAPPPMNWSYVGEENPLAQHGASGLADQMWEVWRERKMDELLAAQLLGVIISGPDISLRRDRRCAPVTSSTTRTFEGGNRDRPVGRYQPMLAKARLPAPEEAWDREARRKGYGSAREWREAMAMARRKAEELEAGGGGGGDVGDR